VKQIYNPPTRLDTEQRIARLERLVDALTRRVADLERPDRVDRIGRVGW
jgi:hypothetical protein